MKVSLFTFWGLLAACMPLLAAESAPLVDSARVQEIASWLPAQPRAFGPSISDRAAWDVLAASPNGSGAIQRAEAMAKKPIPVLDDDMFLDFSRTGNRTRCQSVLSARDARITTFLLAECLENKGRFIQPLCDSIAAICAERTWVLPAHDGSLSNFHHKTMEMDLRATLVGWELATCDCLLGDRLPPETRALIRTNVETRVTLSFREMLEGERPLVHWVGVKNNWNAVCLAGITGAALALEQPPAERAWFVAASEKVISKFLSGFTPDGYCSEGIGYWNYGYGRFLMLSELIRQNTGGKLDLLARPNALPPALYALRTEVINGIYPTISDCHPGSAPDSFLVSYIARRFGIENREGSPTPPAQRPIAFPLMETFLPDSLPVIVSEQIPTKAPLRTWFKDGGVLICRPQTPGQFAAVIKGGNNAESHNHNDVGSFSVLLGKTFLVCDPGGEEYTRRTFSSKRYESKVLNSYGHSVPVVAGTLQRTGSQAKGVVTETNFTEAKDSIAFDLRSAYPVKELLKLERSFDYLRGPNQALIVRDQFAFSEPKAFETALITWSSWKQTAPGVLIIGEAPNALQVTIDSAGKPVSVSSETLNEKVQTHKQPVRIKIALDSPVKDASLTVTIRPAT